MHGSHNGYTEPAEGPLTIHCKAPHLEGDVYPPPTKKEKPRNMSEYTNETASSRACSRCRGRGLGRTTRLRGGMGGVRRVIHQRIATEGGPDMSAERLRERWDG